MTRKQKKHLHNIVQTTMKIVGCSLLFLGMSMGLGISTNVHMEIIAYVMLFLGSIIMIIHSFRGNDHMFLLVSSAGFLLVSNAYVVNPLRGYPPPPLPLPRSHSLWTAPI